MEIKQENLYLKNFPHKIQKSTGNSRELNEINSHRLHLLDGILNHFYQSSIANLTPPHLFITTAQFENIFETFWLEPIITDHKLKKNVARMRLYSVFR